MINAVGNRRAPLRQPSRPWLLSLAAHGALALLGALYVGNPDSRKIVEDADRAAEIVLVQRSPARDQYFSETEIAPHTVHKPLVGSDPSGQLIAAEGTPAAAAPPPLLPGVSLPESAGALPLGDGLVPASKPGAAPSRPRFSSPQDAAAVIAAEKATVREPAPTGAMVRLPLFGTAAVGRSFVFVIDRSQSMGSGGLGAIQAAALELAAQAGHLTADQKLQVVAYNQSVAYFAGSSLVPATDDTKRQLVKFISELAAFGQTEHFRGLLAALRMKPEVIFLLTDGGDPPLDPGQLRVIRQQATGRTSIHCLHFGRGPISEPPEFLLRLAAENRGTYVYIDVNAR